MSSRRQFLRNAAVALGGSVATAGCTNVPASSGDPDETLPSTSSTPETSSETMTATSTDSTTTARDRRRIVRGEADPITVEETITDSKYVYVESNDTVRYSAISSGDGVLEYGYESFDDWARGEGAGIATHAVYDHVDERVDGRYGGGYGSGPDGSAVITLRVTTRVDSDGNVVSEPEVSFAELVAVAPRSVTSTIHFAGHTATPTHEVWVRHVVRQNG
ncbi:hypothetical protein [Halobacterium zhouii]|uniref:hypothetical protein n=1 Tax=Halobacterium zhouii TaxID=2902624 RepID=UPI001E58205A|nr:hypothetical protein [Halobacterium zhouii]